MSRRDILAGIQVHTATLDQTQLSLTLCLPTPVIPATPPAPDAPALPAWFNMQNYKVSLSTSRALANFDRSPTRQNARALSFAIYEALDSALPEGAAIVINSSTGKDSTLMTALYAEYIEQRRAQEKPIRRSAIYVSDTGSEFPEMATRMREEVTALNDWARATTQQYPLTAHLVAPPAKNRLLVELIGNGKPLPRRSNAKGPKTSSAWCMSRVKSFPLDTSVKMAQSEFTRFAQCLGVRSSESARRAAHAAHYGEGLPFGLTRLGEDNTRIGVTPIIHWEDSMFQQELAMAVMPWRDESTDELLRIYKKGTDPDVQARECPITIMPDGAVTTTCGDLSGSRYGCWMCLLSSNRSLINTAKRDKRYAWLRKVHNWIYRQHDTNFERAKLRNESGFNEDTMFPRTYNFQSRYWLLMLVRRAELESGFTLLQPEDKDMIETMWRRHGVHTVSVEDAFRDTEAWKLTGKVRFTWRAHSQDHNALGEALSEGIPSGAFFHLEQVDKPDDHPKRALELAHLIALAGENFVTPLSPTTMSYVFVDRLKADRIIVMVTDTPSILGTKMSTGLLNGLHGASWQLEAIRQPTDWEYMISTGRRRLPKWDGIEEENDLVSTKSAESCCSVGGLTRRRGTWDSIVDGSRSFFYSSTISEEQERSRNPKLSPTARFWAEVRLAENIYAIKNKCPQEPLAQHFALVEDIAALKHKLSIEDLKVLANETADAAFLAEELTDRCHGAARAIRNAILDQVPQTTIEGSVGDKAKKKIRETAKALLPLAEILPQMLEWRAQTLKLCKRIKEGKANAALIARLAFLARLAAVDPEEANRNIEELCSWLGIQLKEGPEIRDISSESETTTDGYETKMPGHAMLDYIESLHQNGIQKETFTGEADILPFPWKLVEVPLILLKFGGLHDPKTVADYARLSGDFPPVVATEDFYVLDGFHRCRAALARGANHIRAYLPCPAQ